MNECIVLGTGSFMHPPTCRMLLPNKSEKELNYLGATKSGRDSGTARRKHAWKHLQDLGSKGHIIGWELIPWMEESCTTISNF